MSLDDLLDGPTPPRRAVSVPSTRPRRLDRTAVITGIPLVALVVAEFWTLWDRRPGGTVSETVWVALGGIESPWYWALGGAMLGFLGWLAAHFVIVGPDCGWRDLLVLVLGCALIGCGLHLVR